MTLKVGMILENAMWLDGTETPQQVEAHKAVCRKGVVEAETESGVICAPAQFTEKRPGEDRVPPVPDHISGPNVRLLVCETTVVAVRDRPLPMPRRFVDDLDKADLMRLRQITRNAAMKAGRGMLTDAQCDDIIEQIGPDIAMRSVRAAVDNRSLH